MNNSKGLLILCLSIAVFGVNDAWGKADRSWSASVAVGSGKGSVKVVIYKHNIVGGKDEEKTATSTNSTIQPANASASGITVASISNRSCQYFVNSADAGYSWDGWYKNAECTTLQTRDQSFEAWSKTTDNQTVTYYAKFTPNTNTAYIVKHYKQNLAGTGYDLADTDNLTGTTDTKVTPNRKSYSGFTAPAGQGVNINGDGSSVVEYYYTRNSYTLTWGGIDGATLSGGTPAGQVKFGATLSTPVPSKTGALFNGWSPEVPPTMPAENVTYTAQWVSKYNIEVTGSNQNMKVGGTQYDAFTFVHAESPTPQISVVSLDSINNGDGQVIEYDAANNKIIAHNAGTAIICFKQAGTETMYESTSATFTYTVTKNDNTLYINGTPNSLSYSMYVDEKWDISLTATNNDYSGSSITATPNNDVTTINDANTQVSSNYKIGTTTWTISQPENYKYKAANASLTVNVVKQAEATDCYVLNDESEHSFSTGLDFSGHFDTPLKINGPAYQLKFDAKKNGYNYFVAQYSTDGGSNWADIVNAPDLGDNYKTFGPYNIPDNTTHIRFGAKTGATLKKWYKNIRVTRKTYLNAANVEITETSSHNPIHPGEKGVDTLTINHSLANGGDLKVKWDNAKFTIDGKTSAEGINLGEKGCSTGVTELAIEYVSQEAGEHKTTVVIYNNVYRATATITGTTNKQQQTITWKENIDILTAGTDIENPASSTVGNVTYTSSDETVISVEGNIIHALKAGKATITAFSAGNAYYADTTEQKEITVTDDKVQYIVWNQSFMNLKIGDGDKTLEASAQSDVVGCTTNGARLITFTSNNESVVKIVNNNQLQIKGIGTTTITATQAGGEDADGHTYIAASVQKKVVVRDPNAECVNYIYIQEGEWRKDLGWNLATNSTETYEIDFHGQEPGYYNVDYKGESHDYGWPYAVPYYNGQLYIDQLVDNNWVNVKSLDEPAEDQNLNTGNISLNRKATKMRFRVTGKAGYFYFKDCTVTLARYLEATNPLNKFEAKVGAQHKQTLSIKYSNIEGPLTLKLTSGKSFSINMESIDGDCGSKGAANIEITYFPSAANEEETDLLTITDDKSNTLKIDLIGSATKTNRHIVWNQEPTPVYTLQTVTLTAEAQTDLNEVAGEVYYTLAQNSTDVGNINGNTLSFTKYGNATVVVNTISNAKYTDAVAVSKTWTVNLTPTQVTTKPTISAPIVSGTSLSDIVLEGGAAQNTVNNQAVEGTFTVTAGDLVNVGEQTLTITFTPNNTDMYDGCTTTITANVIQREPTAGEVGIPSAMPITYGEVINTSSLSGNGTLAGTWNWTEEDANKAMPNAGTVDNLNVYFTPNDANVKKANGTVSLTVYRATPELTWTTEHATATVHETKTFTASSTNTDNTAAITYSIISGDDCATINASTGEVTVLKAGTITVQASQEGTINFNASEPITTTCTISQAPTTITTNPTVGDVVYGTALNKIELVGGVAQNTVNNQSVEGTFAIISEDIPTAGEHSITVTFTPTNTDMYASCTKDISVTVQKAQPDATASADNITYGQKVNESVLSNSGTDGTWTWAEDEKDKVLAVGTHEGLKVHFTPTDQANYNEIDGTVSLTVNKAAATLTWTTAPTSADVKDQLTYQATSNHSESAITYAITEGNDYATINANTGVLTIIKAGTITVQASQAATTNYEEATAITISTTLTGEFETVFTGNGDWNDPNNWTHGLPTSTNPDVVISGNMTIDESISVGSLTIEEGGSVTIIVEGNLTVNGKSKERDAYGDLFVHNGGNVTIGSEASVTVHDFVIESSIGTQDGTSQSGQVDNGNNVIYTNGAYIDINMDPRGNVDPAQWYGFTVPFQVDAKNGVSRKEGDIFRPCTYGVDYMIAEYDMNQRLSTGKGWKFISDYTLQAGHFYYLTVDGTYNTYRFKAKNNTITIENQTTLTTNGTGANANWNAVGNTTLTYATISGNDLPNYVQTYINGQSSYQVVHTQDAQFVVGCPFFFQATKNNTTMVLSKPTGTTSAHYAPRQTDRPICVRIAEEGKGFSDQMYITASEDAQGQYQMGRDLAKAGVGTKSAQLWVNAYNQQLCVNDAPLVANQAFYDMSLFIPKAGNYEISLPTIPTNGTLYLTQDGYPIWNLNDAPYVLESDKGTISEYGLMFEATQAAAPTDVQTISGNDNAQKILKEQSIYIYKNGNIFNVTGQKVK